MTIAGQNLSTTIVAGQTAILNIAGVAAGRACRTALTVTFEVRRSFIRFTQRPALEQAFAFGLEPLPIGGAPVRVRNRFMLMVGHTDQTGSDPLNDALSLRRARAVRAVFLDDADVAANEWESIYQNETWNGPNFELAHMSSVVDPGGSSNTVDQYVRDRTLRLGLFRRYLLALRPDWLANEPRAARPGFVTTPADAVLGCGRHHPVVDAPGQRREENRRVEFFFFRTASAPITDCNAYPSRSVVCGNFISIVIEITDECGHPYSGPFDLTPPAGGILRNQQTDAQGRYSRDNSPQGQYTVEVEGWKATNNLTAANNTFRARLLRPITRNGRALRRGGNDFLFFGTNAYYLLEAAAGGIAGSTNDQRIVQDFFRIAHDCGIRVVRTWAYNDSQLKPPRTRTQTGGPAAHPSQGPGLAALDSIVDLAEQNGIYLILALANYWHDYGGTAQYARWAGYHTTHRQPLNVDPTQNPELGDPDHFVEELFYTGTITDPVAARGVVANPQQVYLDYAIFIINRYRNRTNILAFELMNEPRVDVREEAAANRPARRRALQDALRNWIGTTADTLRGHLPPQQPNQRAPFLSIGSGDMGVTLNDHGVTKSLLSFVFESPLVRNAIDLVDVHLYPVDLTFDPNRAVTELRNAISLAQSLNKPFYLGEFGLPRGTVRNRAQEYSSWSSELLSRSASGMLFWELLPPTRPIFSDPNEINVDTPLTGSLPRSVFAATPPPSGGQGQPSDSAAVIDFVNQQLQMPVSTPQNRTWRMC